MWGHILYQNFTYYLTLQTSVKITVPVIQFFSLYFVNFLYSIKLYTISTCGNRTWVKGNGLFHSCNIYITNNSCLALISL